MTTSAAGVQVYVHMVHGGHLVSLRALDRDGGHCGDDFLFFVRLLRRKGVDGRKVPVVNAVGNEKILKKERKVNGKLPPGWSH